MLNVVKNGQQLSLDSNGNLLVDVAVGGGGGTQYAEGTNQPTATGTVALGKNPSNLLESLALDASGFLKVNVAAGAGGGTASTFGAAFPGTGTAAGATDGTNMQPLKVDGSDNLLVNINAQSLGTVTVGGTVTANQGGAPWTVKPDGTVWTLTGTSANINVTNSTIAVTQSTSPWVTADQNFATQGSTTSGEKGLLIQGAVTTAAPAYTTAQTSPLSLDTSGNLRTTDNHLPASVVLADNLANPTTTQIGSNMLGWDGSGNIWRRVHVSVAGNIRTDGSTVTQPVSQITSPWVVQDTHDTTAGAVATSFKPIGGLNGSIAQPLYVDSQGAPWVRSDTLDLMLLELRSMRAALTILACDGNKAFTSDFQPSNYLAEMNTETVIS